MTTPTITNLYREKMEREGLPEAAISAFLNYYGLLCGGQTGYIPEDNIIPVTNDEIDDFRHIADHHANGQDALPHTVVIKLNGGLGTSMGLHTAKSLIPVKNGLSFLDITALQIRDFNTRLGVSIPLILMNSFNTERASLEALEKYGDISTGIPFSFVQNKFPKIRIDDLTPVSYPQNPELEWNPPGHGDLYAAILSSGILDILIDKGYRYAFISNADNLGATLDTRILGHFAIRGAPFLMEVTDRTFMDRKGGHIARLKNGKLVLREAAQCPPESINCFRDTGKHRYFNTNNLWIRLDTLREMWDRGGLELPMIRNTKKLNSHDSASLEVVQLESAMGSAISVFEGADALRVPRARFAPVKSCSELLLLWSDYYELTDNYEITVNSKRNESTQIDINLDSQYYNTLSRLEARFPSGAPLLAGCESLNITGDVKFGRNVAVTGNVSIINTQNIQISIPDGARLAGKVVL